MYSKPKQILVGDVHFPQLPKMASTTTKTTDTNSTKKNGHFLDIVHDQQRLEMINEEKEAKNAELVGWVGITSMKRKIQISSLIPSTFELNENVDKQLSNKNENPVVKCYEERKQLYIDNWGEEEFQFMFCFPNHVPLPSDDEDEENSDYEAYDF